MSDLVITEKANLVAIADAIREKTGSTEGINFNDFVNHVSELKGINEPTYILGRKIQCGTFIPASSGRTMYVNYDSEDDEPSGVIYWAVSDFMENTDERSYILGCYISDWYRSSLTQASSVIVYEDSATSTNSKPTSVATVETPSGGSIGYPTSGSLQANTVFGAASWGSVALGGTGAKFVAGMEYQYILFGGYKR